MTRPLTRLAATAVTAAMLLAACAPRAAGEVASGTTSSGPWRAIVRDTGGDLGVCLDIVAAGHVTETECDIAASDTGLWRTGDPPVARFLIAMTTTVGAVVAHVRLQDGREFHVPIVAAPGVTTQRIAVLPFDGPAEPTLVDFLDESGVVVASVPFR